MDANTEKRVREEAMKYRLERHNKREEIEEAVANYIKQTRHSWKRAANSAIKNFKLAKGERKLLRLLIIKKYVSPDDKDVGYSDLKSAIKTLRNKLKGQSGGESFVIKARAPGVPKGCYCLQKPVRL